MLQAIEASATGAIRRRVLVNRRSQTVGDFSFDTTLYGPASTLVGIEHTAQGAVYLVSVALAEAVAIETVGARSSG